MNRRKFMVSAAAGAAMLPRAVKALGRHDFRPAQVQYTGGQPNPYPSALRSLMRAIRIRASIDVDEDKLDITLSAPELYYYPFLYLAGRSEFEPFSDSDIRRLALFLKSGGTLLIDDASGIDQSPFDAVVRAEVKRIFPDAPLERLSDDHTIFRSYYMLDRAGGRILVTDSLEGVTIGDRTPLIYCRNDLGGAWATDLYDRPIMPCEPGGERQREMAVRLGLNIIEYALCQNYKKDRIHVETILQRRRLR